jgi:hypothetical protein
MAPTFEVLPGLPGEGPYPEQFTTSGGTHREGFVVRVIPEHGAAWIGNFQPGLGAISKVVVHPDGKTLLVFSRGLAYPIDPETRRLASPAVDDGVRDICVSGDQLVLVGYTGLTILGPGDQRWQSQRLAWDGIKDVCIEGVKLTAMGWDAMGDVWRPVEVALRDGTVKASAYEFEVVPPQRRSARGALKAMVQRLFRRS